MKVSETFLLKPFTFCLSCDILSYMNNTATTATTAHEVYDAAQIAARLTYVTKTEAAFAVKNFASSLYSAAVDNEDDGEAVRAVARAFGKTYDEVCEAAYAELNAAYAANYAALVAANAVRV